MSAFHRFRWLQLSADRKSYLNTKAGSSAIIHISVKKSARCIGNKETKVDVEVFTDRVSGS